MFRSAQYCWNYGRLLCFESGVPGDVADVASWAEYYASVTGGLSRAIGSRDDISALGRTSGLRMAARPFTIENDYTTSVGIRQIDYDVSAYAGAEGKMTLSIPSSIPDPASSCDAK